MPLTTPRRGGVSSTLNYFASSGFDNAPLHALQDGVDGPNGVYIYGPNPAFPNNTYLSTNYWIDVVFSTINQPAPALTSIAPAAGTVGVTVPVTITGSNLAGATLNVGSGITAINVAVVSPTQITANFVIPANAAPGPRSITVTTAAGASNAVLFTINPLLTSPISLWANSALPALASNPDAQAVELGVKFRSDVAGYITGLRFYKGSLNTGTHTGQLWSGNGTLLAQGVFSGETTAGWQQLNLATPVAIAANATYVAAYHTTSGHFSSDGSYFASVGIDNAPLHALRDGSDGPNGVYIYGASPAFPNNTYLSSNYWIDVVFSAIH